MPVNETMPPTRPISTPNGETRPSTTPRTSSAVPSTTNTNAVTLRPRRLPSSSRSCSFAFPIAWIGRTFSTRREPTHDASHVVSTTATAGSATHGFA